MKLLLNEFDLSFLEDTYPNIDFYMLRSDDSPFSFISCIVCVCKTAAEVVDNWQAIQNIISVNYQPPGDLLAWNVYLAFATSENVPEWDRYAIENNKYTARKIILDSLEGALSPDRLIVELQKQLLGSDLILDSQVHEPKEVQLSLDKYVRGAPLDSKVESREIRALMINKIIGFLNQNET